MFLISSSLSIVKCKKKIKHLYALQYHQTLIFYWKYFNHFECKVVGRNDTTTVTGFSSHWENGLEKGKTESKEYKKNKE